MSILLTGASGFLGRIIRQHLRQSHEVIGLSRQQTAENDIVADLSIEVPTLGAAYEYVIHNAGKAHIVPRTAQEADAFFAVNHKGTEHLLQSLEGQLALPKGLLFVSSVAVYGLEAGELISEDQPLAAQDPYGQSKIFAEESVLSWGKKNGVKVSILRLPLLIGKAAPGNLGKMVRGIGRGRYLSIGGGKARRSMVLAEDVAQVIPNALEKGGIFHLTDGQHPSFRELEHTIAQTLGVRRPLAVSGQSAKAIAVFGQGVNNLLSSRKFPLDVRNLQKMTSTLTFSDDCARQLLGWHPRKVIEHPTLWI